MFLSNMTLPTSLRLTRPHERSQDSINFLNHEFREREALHPKISYNKRDRLDELSSTCITKKDVTPVLNFSNHLIHKTHIVVNTQPLTGQRDPQISKKEAPLPKLCRVNDLFPSSIINPIKISYTLPWINNQTSVLRNLI